jgi:hypothetical protein
MAAGYEVESSQLLVISNGLDVGHAFFGGVNSHSAVPKHPVILTQDASIADGQIGSIGQWSEVPQQTTEYT